MNIEYNEHVSIIYSMIDYLPTLWNFVHSKLNNTNALWQIEYLPSGTQNTHPLALRGCDEVSTKLRYQNCEISLRYRLGKGTINLHRLHESSAVIDKYKLSPNSFLFQKKLYMKCVDMHVNPFPGFRNHSYMNIQEVIFHGILTDIISKKLSKIEIFFNFNACALIAA